MIKAVIDTNILVSTLSSRSIDHWVIEGLLEGRYELYVSTEILLEYEEVLKSKYSDSVASNFLFALNELPNVHFVTIYFLWGLIDSDPDDNKFADCYVASAAEYLISHDTDYSILRTVMFPKINVVSLEKFKTILYNYS